ncbi:MAG: GNAT family N-acetyltransferase [Myxococcota bacterium]
MTIRLAQMGELVVLPEIERSASRAFDTLLPGLASVTPAEGWRAAWAAGTLWVIEGEGELVGFLGAEVVASGGSRGLHVLEFDVRLEWQGRGLGRALLLHVLDWARREGMTFVSLTTFRGVRWNGPFYASVGFREVASGTSPRLDGIVAAEVGKGLSDRCGMVLGLG